MTDQLQLPELIWVGITGTRDLVDRAPVEYWLRDMAADYGIRNIGLVVGGCFGTDDAAGRWGHRNGIHVHGVIPPDRRFVADDWQSYCTTWEEIDAGKDGYKRRNQRLVDRSTLMLAFPLLPEDHPLSRRSGTWQTIRMACGKGILGPDDLHIVRPRRADGARA